MKRFKSLDWQNVKEIRFHHRVKRFYYKNLFRKIYTVAIVGLIAANVFSLFKYQSFAEVVNGVNYNITYSTTYETASIIGDDYTNNQNCSCDDPKDCKTKCSRSFTFGTITIPSIGSDIVIMDRNLGADSRWNTGHADRNINGTYNGSTAPSSYGYHYQWGNNYGFSPRVTPNTDNNQAIRTSNSYSNSTFITAHSATWYSNATYNDDWRQGPCPEGWHVPTKDEWQNVYDTLNAGDDGVGFAEALLLPPAGRRNGGITDYIGVVDIVGMVGYYWSSSPTIYTGAHILAVDSNAIGPQNQGNLAMGFSVRCFKDSYVASQPVEITYDPNGGAFSGKDMNQTTVVTYTPGDTYIPDINIQNPNKTSVNMAAQSGWMFDGWYTTGVLAEQTSATEWTGYVDENTQSQTVYAKWLPFDDLPAVTGSDGTEYILMDRNLGATDVWSYGDSETSAAKNGKYYQWGNNYGFSSDSSISPWPYTDTNLVVNTTGTPWGPGNYYSSSTFILRSASPYRWDGPSDTDNGANLWGGNGDTTTADGSSTTEEGRQGPCPSGYHVPSTREWKAIYDALGLLSNEASRITLQTTLHLPFAGRRDYSTSDVASQGTRGDYWSSSRSNANLAYNLFFGSSTVSPQSYSSRTYGLSVRCLKDSPNPKTFTVTFEPENGSGATVVEVESGATATEPTPAPTRDGYAFSGWYLSGAESAFDFSTPITGDITLYAKWGCDSANGYHPDGDICVNAKIGACNSEGNSDINATYATTGNYTWNGDTWEAPACEIVSCNGAYYLENRVCISNMIHATNNDMTTTVSGNTVERLPTTISVIENDVLESAEGEELSEVEGKELVGDVTIDFGGDAIFSHPVQVNIPVEGSSKAYVKVKHVSSDKYNFDGLTRNREASCDGGNIENSNDMYDGAYIDVESGYISIYTCEASNFAAIGLPKVTFEPENGSGATVVEVESGATATEPTPAPTRDGYAFSGWYLSGAESAFDFSTPITGDITLYAKWKDRRIIIQATSIAANQTLQINKYFANAYTVDWGDGGAAQTVSSDKTHTYATAGTYNIILTPSTDRWTFQSIEKPLVPMNGTTMTGVKITYMPSLADGFGTNSTYPGHYFFYFFNYHGAITSLPEGSFDTSHITSVGDYFFSTFNLQGAITSLPKGSFDTSHITSVKTYFFNSFNSQGAITSLPEGSFDISHITSVGDYFFLYFNNEGAITSLPEGSFRFSTGLTSVGANFFSAFNSQGAITSLPKGSFDTSHITSVGKAFFSAFNSQGAITSLPEGSFDTSHTTSVREYFFQYFNSQGALTNLPESFKLNSVAYNMPDAYKNAFNSPNYTLNRKVSDLVAGIAVPSSDRDVFSDNQPGRCGVDANWLETTADACSISYDDGLGGTGEFKYNADTTGVVAGLGMAVPTNEGYSLSGWYDASGNKVDEVVFPDMDGQTLYANWGCDSANGYIDNGAGVCVQAVTVTFNSNSGSAVDPETVISGATATEPEAPTRNGYSFSGWYLSGAESAFDFSTPITGDITLYAKWECDTANHFVDDGNENCVCDAVNGYLDNGSGACKMEVTLTFDSQGGSEVASQTILQDQTRTRPADPTMTDYVFVNWYTSTGYTTVFNFSTPATADTTVYAKWRYKDCNENQKYDPVLRVCYKDYIITYDANGGEFLDGGNKLVIGFDGNGVYKPNVNIQIPVRTCPDQSVCSGYMFAGWFKQSGDAVNQTTERYAQTADTKQNMTVYAKWLPFNDMELTMNGNTYTIMDRNMGASDIAEGTQLGKNTEDESKLGFFYQWGNNYGFRTSRATFPYYNSTRPVNNASNPWGPGNYYYSTTYIVTDGAWTTLSQNLWGGGSSLESDHQGPCPLGYHIPTKGEWNSIISSFNSRKSTTEGSDFCSDLSTIFCFTAKLKLPYAWYREYYSRASMQGNAPLAYWSSTSNSNNGYNTYSVYVSDPKPTSTTLDANNISLYNNAAVLVRCMKNSKWLVTFNPKGGAMSQVKYEVTKGSTVSKPSNPTRSDASFVDWYEDADLTVKYNFSNPVTGNKILYAKRNCGDGYITDGNDCVPSYTVTFNDGETVLDIEPLSVAYGSTITLPSAPQKSGAIFTGWYKEPSLQNIWDEATDVVTSNITLYAKYECDTENLYIDDGSRGCIKAYTVTFDLNGGDGEIDSQIVPEGSYATRPQSDPTKEGWTFTGWYAKYYSTQEYNFESTAVTGDITLYAYWTQVVTLHPNGGAISGKQIDETVDVIFKKNNSTYRYGDTTIDYLPTLKDGYIFGGWYTTPTDQTVKWSGKVEDSNEITMVYAKWIPVVSKEVTFGNTTFEIMDRNLGAETSGTGSSSYGFFFQWGNNFGFPKNLSLLNYSNNYGIDASAYGPGNYYYNNSFKIYVVGQVVHNYWDSSHNKNLWGNTVNTDEARQGPCPTGYHVPSKADWVNMISAYNTRYSTQDRSEICTGLKNVHCFSKLLLLPFAGYIANRDTDNYGYNIDRPKIYNDAMLYRSSEYGVDILGFSTRDSAPSIETSRATNFGLSIRCFKNNQVYDTVFTVNYETNSGSAIDGATGLQLTKITNPGNPMRNGSVFSGWYRESDFQNLWNFNSDVLIDNITLYAQYTCDTANHFADDGNGGCVCDAANGYIDDGEGGCKLPTVTFNSNSGSPVDLQAVASGTAATEPEDPSKDGYSFVAWYLDEELTQLFTFSTPITGDITLFAKWHDDRCPAEYDEYDETLGICYNLDTTYTVPVYYGTDINHTYSGNQIGTITLKMDKGPYSGSTLTMMDMNLGASVAGTGVDSYGYHYQWGNNYGFAHSLTTGANPEYFSTDRATNKNYWPGHRYNNPVFIYGTGDYWENDKYYDNLRGGSGDSSANNRGGINNGSTRQGPCPEGYHIPSIGEWNTLVTYWYNFNNSTPWSYTNFHFFTGNAALIKDFMNIFKLPKAGYRYHTDAIVGDQAGDGYYRSSSPASASHPNYARRLNFYSSELHTNNVDHNGIGYSVRCFKDSVGAPETLTLTFNENGGNLLGATGATAGQKTLIQKVESGSVAVFPVQPTKDNAFFSGWTTDESGANTFNFSTPVTASGTLYAQYTCDAANHFVESGNVCVCDSANGYHPDGDICANVKIGNCNPVVSPDPNATYTTTGNYTWSGNTWVAPTCTISSCNGKSYLDNERCLVYDDLELYFIKSDGTLAHYTLMDRNMGATEVYNQNYSSPNPASYGYYYKWGNNQGFTADDLNQTFIDAPSEYASQRGYQGLCPTDYYIPYRSLWYGFYTDWDTSNIWGEYLHMYSDKGKIFALHLLLPFAGSRSYIGGNVQYVGDYGAYWSSNPYRSYGAYFLKFFSSSVRPQEYDERAYGFSVRCFKNSPSQTLTLDADGGKQAVIAFTGSVGNGTFTTLSEPVKEGYTFEGWYSDVAKTNKVVKGDSVTTPTLYAKWHYSACAADQDYDEELGICYKLDTTNVVPVYYGTDLHHTYSGNQIGTITVKINTGTYSGQTLTLMDMNLGATTSGTSSNAYGELYQWGNNAPIKTATSVADRVTYENYRPGHPYPYSSPTFRRGNGMQDYWESDNSTNYNNLRGGSGDSSANNRGGINNGNIRQGPCPDGYHVPSIMEWDSLIQYFASAPGIDLSLMAGNFHYFTQAANVERFETAFKLPLAGRREGNSISTSNGYYWSSSQNGSSNNYRARYLRLSSSRVDADSYGNRTYGNSVRCFKDSANAPETLTLTFNENKGSLRGATDGTLIQLVSSGKVAQVPLQPTMTGANFQKWSTDQAGADTFNFSTPVTASGTLYAQYTCISANHFIKDENGVCVCDAANYYVDDGNGQCVLSTRTITYHPNGGAFSGMATNTVISVIYTPDINGNYIPDQNIQFPAKEGYAFDGWYTTAVNQTTQRDGIVNSGTNSQDVFAKWISFNDLEIQNSIGRTLFAIMDRNLGAEISGTGLTSYGNYYQWGNNYGFANNGTIQTSSDQVDASSYGPNNYFSNLTFITRSSAPFRRDTTDNTNLWGGASDTTTSRGNGTDSDRQGPCPDGYHVPSTLEWKVAKDLWCESKGDDNLCIAENFVNDLSLPYAGYRGSDNGDIDNQGEGGFYWSSSSSSDNNAYYLNVLNMNPQQDERRAAGFSVRCFKNTSNKTIVYNTNGGNDLSNGTAVSRWMSGDVLPTPIHSDSHKVFTGWYTTSSFDEGSQVTTNTLSTDADGGTITLYAKWECEDNYHLEGNICVNDKNNTTNCREEGEKPENSHYNVVLGSGTWNGEEYVGDVLCGWLCDDTYHQNGNVCESNKNNDTACREEGEKPENSHYNIVLGPGTWNGEKYVGDVACGWLCDDTHHQSGDICDSNTKKEYCITGTIENGDYIVELVDVSWNMGLSDWNDIPACINFTCNAGYHRDGNVCRINSTPSGGSSGGGGGGSGRRWSVTDEDEKENNAEKTDEDNNEEVSEDETHGSAEDEGLTKEDENDLSVVVTDQTNDDVSSTPQYTPEFQTAYSFAKSNGITTTSTIQDAKMYTDLTRIQMAKMMSYYAMNVLGQTPDISKGTVKFNDVPSKLDAEYDYGVTLSYQLGIMGVNMKNNNFRPKDKVTRAEFVTALSRMIYNIEDGKGTIKYYEPHMAKMYNEGVITNTNPNLIEKRGYVMLMLMRAGITK